MVVLFLVTVAAGCAIPFFMEDGDTLKKRVFYYMMLLADVALMIIMIESNLAGLPTYGKPETIFIGCGAISICLMAARLSRIIGKKKNVIKKPSNANKNHRAAS